MADHVISVSERINVFGLAPSTKWGSFSWGTDKWGEGSPETIFLQIEKYLGESQASSDSIAGFDVTKYMSEIQPILAVETNTTLTDGSGYSYIYPGPTDDAEGQIITDWTESTQSSTWTSMSAGSTEWT